MAASKDDFPWLVIVIRALMGVCEGGTFPSISAMMAKWAPQNERSRMSTFIYAGLLKVKYTLNFRFRQTKMAYLGNLLDTS